MIRGVGGVLIAGALTVAPAPARAAEPIGCGPSAAGERRISGAEVDLAWRPAPAPISIGKPFSIEFAVCPRGPAPVAIDRVKVDAWMPAHRHGMNYAPTLSGAAPGPLRADGLVFHMPGRWQVVFELRAGERPLRLTDDLTVK
ncbi:MAG: FixH family protein [Burkholderiaceae bacterium]